MTWENKITEGDFNEYYSRIIASFYIAGGNPGKRPIFKKWLESLGVLSDKDIYDICNLAENGKLELQEHAKLFLENLKGETK